ncbi:Probable RNA polymerase sigma factor [Capnocytophaga canimorsus Cc5]|uniref:Probable RNA polymerase sigma factor n=1 Tax=Capnocytophaga canimorsus (strain 5) TaxID=860228 RepID=F9YUR9_CAPCC|nr:sigma-70 family RNA polymerase sigma factor [Capnocytophaga canimorsus]AEK23044.1 Probable RNA polymerase sigma factor [Capnocytophaga canimorsus Cc5]
MSSKNKIIGEWIDAYSQALLNKALYLLSDKEEAMDMVQEVFLAAFTSFESFKHQSSPMTWLSQILKYKVADFYRLKYKNPVNISVSDFFDSQGNWADNSVLENWTAFTEDYPYDDFHKTLYDCLERLPLRWKIPVKLYYLEDKKAPEVCQQTGITTTNLWKILQRSRLQLRTCIETNQ